MADIYTKADNLEGRLELAIAQKDEAVKAIGGT